MRTILIDPKTRSISEHEYDGDWKTIAPTIGAELFTVARVEDGDLFLDDEGLYATERHWFIWDGVAEPFVNSGLLFGVADSEGESTPCILSIEEVESRVRWVNAAQIHAWANAYSTNTGQ